MRGLYTATVLDTVARHFAAQRKSSPLDPGLGFDLISGTSTGGILACALAAGVPLEKVASLYVKEGPKIFTDPMPTAGLGLFRWVFRNRNKAANSNAHLKQTLEGFFRNETLAEMYRRRGVRLCIPTVKASEQVAKVFKTPHLPRLTRDGDYRLADVCLATSAAPIFLPLVDIAVPAMSDQSFTYADGGLWANNPVLVALVEALELIGTTKRPIEILSIGTCPAPEGQVITPGHENFGFLQWRAGTKIVSLSLNAQASGHAFVAKLLADRLTALGQPVRIVRLDSAPRSAEQMRHMTLDGASPDAIRALTQAGIQDGEMAIRRCDGGSPQLDNDGRMLAAIFNDMPCTKG
jgi:patatin-like phospholipase/acyl hydrolase